jgi:photosystem II stability/assembly factor-like uncharacterized protein
MKRLIYILFFFVISNFLNAQSSWVSQTNPFGSANLGKIQFVSATEGWISAGNGKLLHTTNGGNNWLAVNPEPVDTIFSWSDPAVSMSFVNALTGYVIRTKGNMSQWNGAVVYKTSNGGINWNKLIIPDYDAGMMIQFTDENNGWILEFDADYTGGGIFKTTNGGISWNGIYPPVGGFLFFANSNTGWLMPIIGGAIATSDSIRKTTNGGLNWTTPWGTNAQVIFNCIHFSDVNNGWVVGKGGIILHTTNGGTSWNYVTNAGITSTYTSKTVFFLNANTGWIGTKDSTNGDVYILYTNNGGSSWSVQTPNTGGGSIFNINFFDALNGGLTAGNVILHTTNGGVKVNTISTEIPSKYSMNQNYPNPFNPSTNIKYQITNNGFVLLKILDALGREVETLVNEKQSPGTYEVTFDASKYPSGIYFYKIESGSYTETKRMIFVK